MFKHPKHPRSYGLGVRVVIYLDRGADLHTAQLMPLPLTVTCFSKIQTGFAFLVPAYLGSPGKRAVKRVCVCVRVCRNQRFLRLLVLSLGGGAEVVEEMVEELEGRPLFGRGFPAVEHHVVEFLRTLDGTSGRLQHAPAVANKQQRLRVVFACRTHTRTC